MQSKKSPVGCVIMASGLGKRFGGNKLLAPFAGAPLITHILDITGDDLFANRIVVTRHPEIQAICMERGIPVLLHEYPEQSDTIRLGLTALMDDWSKTHDTPLFGCLFALGDQPLLRRESLEAMVQAFTKDLPQYLIDSSAPVSGIYRLCFQDQVGSPSLFGNQYFEELLHLPDGKGGNILMNKYPDQIHYVSARDACELADVDTPEALAALEHVKNALPPF